MKRIALMLIVSCLFTAKSFSQEASAENPNAPEMTFEKLVHDFGTIPLNGEAEYEFTFTNTGKEPLIIQSCQSTCGCTVPTCPRDKPILPGQTGSIKVRYTTTNVAGAFNRPFTVITNAKNSPIRVTIMGEISRSETAAN